jgi:ABC-type dipeptide/oligopeptide/nickel transport system permease subunit
VSDRFQAAAFGRSWRAVAGQDAVRRLASRHFARRPLAIVSWMVLALLLVVAVFGPLIVRTSPLLQSSSALLPAGSPGHLLGTDDLGRDELSRLAYGARPLVLISLAATALAGLLGVTVGMVAGYLGGRVDNLLMRVVDLGLALPSVMLIILLVAGLGTGPTGLILGLGISLAPGVARIARALAAGERGRDYVVAARLGGARAPAIMLGEMLPNMGGQLLAQAAMTLSVAAGFEAGLSYVGLGIQPPTPDWGYMVAEGQQFLYGAPALDVLPALATLIFVVACNFVADDLRDGFDPADGR